MADGFWTGLGIGVLIGALVFDQIWRQVNRMRDRLDLLRGDERAVMAGALDRIERLGHGSGPGFGFTCAEIAAEALGRPLRRGDRLAKGKDLCPNCGGPSLIANGFCSLQCVAENHSRALYPDSDTRRMAETA